MLKDMYQKGKDSKEVFTEYRKTFSVIYAETINRKIEYTHEEGCTLSITEKTFLVNVLQSV
jgi:hypothetical protein